MIQCRFNSRPHEEVDQTGFNRYTAICTFQLTTSRRGRRYADKVYEGDYFVSTHDLTKRSTLQYRDLVGLVMFQLTTSRRGRRRFIFLRSIQQLFQLTTSRRGRHRKGLLSRGGCCFNSRPHEEVDDKLLLEYFP